MEGGKAAKAVARAAKMAVKAMAGQPTFHQPAGDCVGVNQEKASDFPRDNPATFRDLVNKKVLLNSGEKVTIVKVCGKKITIKFLDGHRWLQVP